MGVIIEFLPLKLKTLCILMQKLPCHWAAPIRKKVNIKPYRADIIRDERNKLTKLGRCNS